MLYCGQNTGIISFSKIGTSSNKCYSYKALYTIYLNTKTLGKKIKIIISKLYFKYTNIVRYIGYGVGLKVNRHSGTDPLET